MSLPDWIYAQLSNIANIVANKTFTDMDTHVKYNLYIILNRYINIFYDCIEGEKRILRAKSANVHEKYFSEVLSRSTFPKKHFAKVLSFESTFQSFAAKVPSLKSTLQKYFSLKELCKHLQQKHFAKVFPKTALFQAAEGLDGNAEAGGGEETVGNHFINDFTQA